MKTTDRRPVFKSNLAKIPQGTTDQNRDIESKVTVFCSFRGQNFRVDDSNILLGGEHE